MGRELKYVLFLTPCRTSHVTESRGNEATKGQICFIDIALLVNCEQECIESTCTESTVNVSRLADEEEHMVVYNLRGSCGSPSSK